MSVAAPFTEIVWVCQRVRVVSLPHLSPLFQCCQSLPSILLVPPLCKQAANSWWTMLLFCNMCSNSTLLPEGTCGCLNAHDLVLRWND